MKAVVVLTFVVDIQEVAEPPYAGDYTNLMDRVERNFQGDSYTVLDNGTVLLPKAVSATLTEES